MSCYTSAYLPAYRAATRLFSEMPAAWAGPNPPITPTPAPDAPPVPLPLPGDPSRPPISEPPQPIPVPPPDNPPAPELRHRDPLGRS